MAIPEAIPRARSHCSCMLLGAFSASLATMHAASRDAEASDGAVSPVRGPDYGVPVNTTFEIVPQRFSNEVSTSRGYTGAVALV